MTTDVRTTDMTEQFKSSRREDLTSTARRSAPSQVHHAAIAALILPLTLRAAEPNFPPALIACEEARKGWMGRLEWTVSTFRDDLEVPALVKRFITTIARNGDWGIEEVLRAPKPNGGLPVTWVRNSSGDWEYPAGGSAAGWYTNATTSSLNKQGHGIRWVGIWPDISTMKPDRGFRALGTDPQYPVEKWTTSRDGAKYVVTGEARRSAV